MAYTRQDIRFDLKLVIDCAETYSMSTGLGCTVNDSRGTVLYESGAGCNSCTICDAIKLDKDQCVYAHAYGMSEAEQFGGKYIYFCPVGLTCFVSPIVGPGGSSATIISGPFLMVDLEDFITFDLRENLGLEDESVERVTALVRQVPFIPPDKVNALSSLLFMAAGFMNNVWAANRMIEMRDLDSIQSQISDYILEQKGESRPPEYPIKTEKKLLTSIADSDKPTAQKLLNKLLGHILFSSGGDLERIKSKTYELLVIISRSAVDAGVSTDQAFRMNHRFWKQAQTTVNIDGLCLLLSDIMNRYIDSIFDFSEKKNVDVLHKAVHYMRQNCLKKISVEDVAKIVYLSPTYFSKVFKNEMGCSFNTYLNQLRIEKSKPLLLQDSIRLADIAVMVGFEDQSYFTKVFKRIIGTSPKYFRKSKGRV